MGPRLKSRCARCCGAGSRLMSLTPLFTAPGSGPAVLTLHDADGGLLRIAPQVEPLASALRILASPRVLH